jgi:hypothetical protein
MGVSLAAALSGGAWLVAGGAAGILADGVGVESIGAGVGCVKYRRLYPPNWEALAWECKERAGWCCEGCGVAHGADVVNERTGVVYKAYLGAAHLDHDPWNPSPRLAALCPACHARYDCSWRERQRWLALERMRHQMLLAAYWQREADGKL